MGTRRRGRTDTSDRLSLRRQQYFGAAPSTAHEPGGVGGKFSDKMGDLAAKASEGASSCTCELAMKIIGPILGIAALVACGWWLFTSGCKLICGCFKKCAGNLCGGCSGMCKDPFGGGGGILGSVGSGAVSGVTHIASGIGGIFGKVQSGRMVQLPQPHTQMLNAALPSHYATVGYCIMLAAGAATGALILMSEFGPADSVLVARSKLAYCVALRLSMDFNTSAMFDEAIDAHLSDCSSDRMEVIHNSYYTSCLDTKGKPRYSDTELRDAIWHSIEYANSFEASSSPIFANATCNATTGSGYYTLEGAHVDIREVCAQIRIIAAVTDTPTLSILHDLHDLHIPGCRNNHTVVLSNTFEKHCQPPRPGLG